MVRDLSCLLVLAWLVALTAGFRWEDRRGRWFLAQSWAPGVFSLLTALSVGLGANVIWGTEHGGILATLWSAFILIGGPWFWTRSKRHPLNALVAALLFWTAVAVSAWAAYQWLQVPLGRSFDLLFDKANADKANADKANADKANADKANADKANADKANADKANADKANADKANADKDSTPQHLVTLVGAMIAGALFGFRAINGQFNDNLELIVSAKLLPAGEGTLVTIKLAKGRSGSLRILSVWASVRGSKASNDISDWFRELEVNTWFRDDATSSTLLREQNLVLSPGDKINVVGMLPKIKGMLPELKPNEVIDFAVTARKHPFQTLWYFPQWRASCVVAAPEHPPASAGGVAPDS